MIYKRLSSGEATRQKFGLVAAISQDPRNGFDELSHVNLNAAHLEHRTRRQCWRRVYLTFSIVIWFP